MIRLGKFRRQVVYLTWDFVNLKDARMRQADWIMEGVTVI